MANTNTNTRIITSDRIICQQFLLVSDGSEETDLIVYDSSVVATALGITDPLSSTILRVQMAFQNAATFTNWTLEYDANTDVMALPVGLGASSSGASYIDMDFRDQGGIVNLANGTAGATGDILLTTSALDAGDTVLMSLWVRPR